MPTELSQETRKMLLESRIGYRFHDRAVSHIEDEQTGRIRAVGRAFVICDLFDDEVGGKFKTDCSALVCSGEGGTEGEALMNALAKWKTSPKPLTAAQKNDPRYAQLAQREAAKDDEIGRLRKRIAELEGDSAKAGDKSGKAGKTS